MLSKTKRETMKHFRHIRGINADHKRTGFAE